MCTLHIQPYRPIYLRQFSEAYDIYLRILREVDKRVSQALLRDTADWRMKHACPPCMYKLESETELPFDLLLSIDGGNSLKRFTTPGSSVGQPFFSDYVLPREVVDERAGEVVHRVRARGRNRVPETDQDVDMELDPGTIYKAGEIDATATPKDDPASICVERWKANADESKKIALSCFDETGTFVVLCRHGHVLIICDMRQSGEL